MTQSGHGEAGAVNRAGEVFYRNGIELPLTLELLAIFLLPTRALLCGSGDEGGKKNDLGR